MKTTIINSTATVKSVLFGVMVFLLIATSLSPAGTWVDSPSGNYTGDWSDVNHWDTGAVPVAGESVYFTFNATPPVTPATITLTANTAHLNQTILQGGSVSGTIPERDLTIDLAGNDLSGNTFFAPYQGYRELSKLTFVSTGNAGKVYNSGNASGMQFYLFAPGSGGAVTGRPTESHVTLSTNTQGTFWHTAVGTATDAGTSAQIDAYLYAEENADLSFSGYINVGASGGTSSFSATGTVTVSDNAAFTQASGQTMTLGSADGYSTGNLTISGGGTDVDLGVINWRTGTFTVELDSPTIFNPVNVIGNLTIADGVLFDVNLLAGTQMSSEPLPVMTWGGTRTGEFTLTSTAAASYYTLDYDDVAGTLFLSIPEPSAAMLLLVGLTGLLRRRARRETE